jgi:hypothetical protein
MSPLFANGSFSINGIEQVLYELSAVPFLKCFLQTLSGARHVERYCILRYKLISVVVVVELAADYSRESVSFGFAQSSHLWDPR